MKSNKPNLLLITVDQMRSDCLNLASDSLVETPNLAQLAQMGTVFTNAYSATPSCVPARAAIFTGMSQRSHGRVGYKVDVPWNYEYTLPGELARAGYHTQGVGKMHVYPSRNLCGFHNVVLHDGYTHYNRAREVTTVSGHFDEVDDYLPWLRREAGADSDLTDQGLDCNASTVAMPWNLPERLHPTNWTVSQSIDFLRRRDPRKPFFLWTSFVRPHPPFDPPQSFYELYLNAELPDPPIGDWVDRNAAALGGVHPTTGHGRIGASRLQRSRAAYYALITHIDHQLGKLMGALREHGVFDNTLIVFTSDHGEMLGDHYRFGKALPYEGSVRIPLLIADPGNRLALARGRREECVAELRDIMPTLLDAAGVPLPGTVEGSSLLPLCREETVAPWREYIHGEHEWGRESSHYVTDGKEKYIWFSATGEEQLFDLLSDPQEKVNLAALPTAAERLSIWRARLITELTGREEGYVADGRLAAGRKAQTTLSHLQI